MTQRTRRAMMVWTVPALVSTVGAGVRDDAGNTGFQLLEEPVNPAIIAMGAAGAAYAGRGFQYYNPALPFLAGQRYLSVEYGQYPAGDLQRGHIEGAWVFPAWFLAASFHSESIKNIYGATPDGKVNLDLPFSAQLSTVALDIGYVWYERLAAGLCFNGVQDRIGNSSAFAWALGIGGAFKAIPGKLDMGMSLINPQVEIEGSSKTYRILWGSTNYLDTTEEFLDGPGMPLTFRVGAAWTDSLKALPYRTALDIVYRGTDGRVMVPVGLEIRPVASLALRMGKRFGHDTEVMSLGLGLALAAMSLDLSFSIPRLENDAELKWLLGVAYSLKGYKDASGAAGAGAKRPPAAATHAPVKDAAVEAETAQGIEELPAAEADSVVPAISDTVSAATVAADSVSSSQEPAAGDQTQAESLGEIGIEDVPDEGKVAPADQTAPAEESGDVDLGVDEPAGGEPDATPPPPGVEVDPEGANAAPAEPQSPPALEQ